MAVFTDRFLKGLKPRDQIYELRDLGCPGLVIRVGQRGRKVWEVIVSRDGRRRRVRLGTYPDMSLAEARRAAEDHKAAPAVHSRGMRVRELWKLYAAETKPRRRAWRDVEQAWTKWADPIIGGVRLEELNVRHGSELIGHVVKRSTPNRARKVIRYLNPMLKFAAGRGLIVANPWAGLAVPEGVGARDRVLRREEWLSLWRWAEAAPYPFGPLLRVLMLSAQRLGEVAGMRWDELDLSDGKVWVIPASRHKGRRGHEVPLPRALAALLADLPRHDKHVFSLRPERHVSPGSDLKNRISRDTGLTDWRFHDIRRTAATLMAEGSVPRFTVQRLLGHADQTVTAVYDRHSYRDEKRAALEALARTVAQ